MQREQWGSRFGFIMAAAGSAVGLGNIWKFPYLAGTEGGGAFLIVYVGFLVTIGVSLMMAEIAIGRAAHLNPIGAFRKLGGNRWMPVGALGVITAFILLSFYSVVGGWTVAYIVKSISGSLVGGTAEELGQQFGALVSSVGEPIFYHGVFMALTIGIVLAGVAQGIERSVKIMMPALFILLLILVVRSVTLDGAWEGVVFFLTPDWSQVDGGMLSAALGQAFFSLSLGMGALITYGSYLNADANIRSASCWVVGLDTMVAVLAGLMVLPAVFAFNLDPGAGPGLTFITLPAVFGEMWAGAAFQVFFFVMLLIAALTSSISLLAIPVAFFSEQFGIERKKSAVIIGAIIFVMGVPSSLSMGLWADFKILGLPFFDLMSELVDRVLMPVGGMLTALFAGWVAFPKMAEELTNRGTLPFPMLNVWKWMARVFCPLAVGWVMYVGLA
ncbi:sodium-dependent transporter [Rhodobacteraceae bacterium RKSG542]|uniref:sodium-dependent transporter n=1 Tax=Pseudovibrio flavus TaxID=2529854 RepID=UPI0012BCECAA|nr:sodium-dependent transporter [Pseudovibrio flavus]MTI19386.1 sodium-dependent transporter [Pseudovibrio flavus]